MYAAFGDGCTMMLRPWQARNPKSFENPGLDFTPFNVPYWQKFERMLRFARERDMIISVIQDISTHNAQPAAGREDERRYLRYAVARLGAFTGEIIPLPPVQGPKWTSPGTPAWLDWALLLQKRS